MKRLLCAICLYLGGEATKALTVINGQAVCEAHMGHVGGEPFTSALRVAR